MTSKTHERCLLLTLHEIANFLLFSLIFLSQGFPHPHAIFGTFFAFPYLVFESCLRPLRFLEFRPCTTITTYPYSLSYSLSLSLFIHTFNLILPSSVSAQHSCPRYHYNSPASSFVETPKAITGMHTMPHQAHTVDSQIKTHTQSHSQNYLTTPSSISHMEEQQPSQHWEDADQTMNGKP